MHKLCELYAKMFFPAFSLTTANVASSAFYVCFVISCLLTLSCAERFLSLPFPSAIILLAELQVSATFAFSLLLQSLLQLWMLLLFLTTLCVFVINAEHGRYYSNNTSR